ncbi:MAG: hypothetical protein V4731_11495 [Pseudomonadota bacterium]
MKQPNVAICMAEDRQAEEPALRVAMASARLANPGVPIVAFMPNATDAFVHWAGTQGQIDIRRYTPGSGNGWNVKPHALLELLNEGKETVWWIDSDVVVLQTLSTRFAGIAPDALVATEEAEFARYHDEGARAEAWGFEVTRHFGFTLNSGVLRVTRGQQLFLHAWANALRDEAYLAAQGQPWDDRPFHLLGDQDVMTALLCSPQFSQEPVHILRRGTDIIQYFSLGGYSLWERMVDLRTRSVAFIHSQSYKPWRRQELHGAEGRRNVKAVLDDLMSDTSPHSLAALALRPHLGDSCEWARPRTWLGAVLRRTGMGSRALTGLPLAVLADIYRHFFRRQRTAVPRTQ